VPTRESIYFHTHLDIFYIEAAVHTKRHMDAHLRSLDDMPRLSIASDAKVAVSDIAVGAKAHQGLVSDECVEHAKSSAALQCPSTALTTLTFKDPALGGLQSDSYVTLGGLQETRVLYESNMVAEHGFEKRRKDSVGCEGSDGAGAVHEPPVGKQKITEPPAAICLTSIAAQITALDTKIDNLIHQLIRAVPMERTLKRSNAEISEEPIELEKTWRGVRRADAASSKVMISGRIKKWIDGYGFAETRDGDTFVPLKSLRFPKEGIVGQTVVMRIREDFEQGPDRYRAVDTWLEADWIANQLEKRAEDASTDASAAAEVARKKAVRSEKAVADAFHVRELRKVLWPLTPPGLDDKPFDPGASAARVDPWIASDPWGGGQTLPTDQIFIYARTKDNLKKIWFALDEGNIVSKDLDIDGKLLPKGSRLKKEGPLKYSKLEQLVVKWRSQTLSRVTLQFQAPRKEVIQAHQEQVPSVSMGSDMVSPATSDSAKAAATASEPSVSAISQSSVTGLLSSSFAKTVTVPNLAAVTISPTTPPQRRTPQQRLSPQTPSSAIGLFMTETRRVTSVSSQEIVAAWVELGSEGQKPFQDKSKELWEQYWAAAAKIVADAKSEAGQQQMAKERNAKNKARLPDLDYYDQSSDDAESTSDHRQDESGVMQVSTKEVDEFLKKHGIDDRAAQDLRECNTDVQTQVLSCGDKVKGARNPSAYMVGMVKRLKTAEADASGDYGLHKLRLVPWWKDNDAWWEEGDTWEAEQTPLPEDPENEQDWHEGTGEQWPVEEDDNGETEEKWPAEEDDNGEPEEKWPAEEDDDGERQMWNEDRRERYAEDEAWNENWQEEQAWGAEDGATGELHPNDPPYEESVEDQAVFYHGGEYSDEVEEQYEEADDGDGW